MLRLCHLVGCALLLAGGTLAAATWAGAAAMGGVPSATWQDTDRPHRRSPSAVPDSSNLGLRAKAFRPVVEGSAPDPGPATPASGISLGARANTEGRAAKVRTQMADNSKMPVPGSYLGMLNEHDWRLRIREAAVAAGEMVTVGDIADPLGTIPPDVWRSLAATPLWPAPKDAGKPYQVNKAKLSQALREVLKDTADRCLIPTSLAIQRGGFVLREDDLRAFLVKALTPQLATLPGKAELNEFRLPPYIFLSHPQQRIELEPGKVVPGRITYRFVVREMDNTVLRKVAGSAFLDLWVEVPAAARPLNKGDALLPEAVTFIRMNVAHMKDMPWDGRGGPWQVVRAVATGQPLFRGDLATQAMVRKGNIVLLQYNKGNVRIAAQAEALADGEPGESIAVRNLQTRKQVFATVQDAQTVIAK